MLATTQWSSSYLIIECILEVKIPLTALLEELEWDGLALSKWKNLEILETFLKPFAIYTALAGGEEYTTTCISSMIPIILDLHPKEMSKVPELRTVSGILMKEMECGFGKYTDNENPEYDSTFVVATLVDLRYR